MVLGDVEEVHTLRGLEEGTGRAVQRTETRSIPMLFLRGDLIVLVSPPLRTA